MDIEFSEFALTGLRTLVPDHSRQQSAFASLKWYLNKRGALDSRPCPAFENRKLYIYPWGPYRVVYEVSDTFYIWSILLLSEYDLTFIPEPD